MKQNSKLALMIFGASVLGSAATIFATSALKQSNGFSDTYFSSTEQEQNSGFIRTAARVASVETDFTVAAEKSINAVVSVKPFATPHDAAQSCGYTAVTPDGRRISIATDLGHVTDTVMNAIYGSDLVMLESNHEIDLLRRGPYPYPLKQRILSDIGHLSNTACSDAAVKLLDSGTVRFMLGHLSKQNNTPDLAYETTHSAFTIHGAKAGSDYLLGVAGDNGKAISF